MRYRQVSRECKALGLVVSDIYFSPVDPDMQQTGTIWTIIEGGHVRTIPAKFGTNLISSLGDVLWSNCVSGELTAYYSTAYYFIRMHGWQFKISKILNFRKSEFKLAVCLQNIKKSKYNGQIPLDKLKLNQKSYHYLQNSAFWGRLSMESRPQNPEFRNNPENFHPWECRNWSYISIRSTLICVCTIWEHLPYLNYMGQLSNNINLDWSALFSLFLTSVLSPVFVKLITSLLAFQHCSETPLIISN